MQGLEDVFEEMRKQEVEKWKGNAKLMSLKKLMEINFPPNQWKVDQLIPLEGITIISAAPASYKTWLILQMAIDIAQGKPFLDQFPCLMGGVLMIDEENHQRLVQKRFKALGAPEDLPIYFLSKENFVATDEKMTKGVLEYCEERLIDTIFIDSLVRINRADENDAGNMASVFRALSEFCKAGKTVVVTHHERKETGMRSSAQNRMRGSSDISAAVDSHLAISRDKKETNRLVVEHAKSREELEVPAFEVAVHREGERTWFEHLGSYDVGKKKKEEAKEIIINLLQGKTEGLSKGEIAKAIKESSGIGNSSTYEALKELVWEELIEERQGSGNTKICTLRIQTDEPQP